MSLTRNVVAFRRGLFLLSGVEDNERLAATIQAELMNLGFMLDAEAFQRLRSASETDAIRFYEEVVAWIRSTLGAGSFTPLYAGFPQDVMARSDVELFVEQLAHYCSGGEFLVPAASSIRPTAFEKKSFKPIRAATEEEFRQIPRDLLTSQQALAPSDVETLRWFFENTPKDEIASLLPNKIPFKENLCLLVATLKVVPPNLTTTDALRVIVSRSGGDVSLPAQADKIRKFSRRERREILEMLESTRLSVEEMSLKRERWLRVGEILHPGESAERYPKTFAAFQRLRNERVRTWQARVENAPTLAEKLRLLAGRPGEFARRLDETLRSCDPKFAKYAKEVAQARRDARAAKRRLRQSQLQNAILQALRQAGQPRDLGAEIAVWLENRLTNARKTPEERFAEWERSQTSEALPSAPPSDTTQVDFAGIDAILDRFESVADKVSLKVLYELYARFEERRRDEKFRSVTVKGARRPTLLAPLPAFDGAIVDRVQETIIAAVKKHYALLPPLGTVWVDPKLAEVPLVTDMRTVSDSLQAPVVRGARIPFANPNAKVIRFYVHWRDPQGTYDLDLSATFVGKNALDCVSFHNLRQPHGVHSGDVRNRKGDCAEYVDIVLDEARRKFDYVLVDVRNYSGGNGTVGELAPVAGYMEREFPEANTIWAPSTVENGFVLTSPNRAVYVAAIDLQTLEYVVMDVDAQGRIAATDLDSTMRLLEQYIAPPKLSVADLLRWHVEARGGTEVAEKENAETLFDAADFTKNYVETLKLMFPEI